jgi:hypothetical protein
MQAWHSSNFQIRANLCSPCHYIFRAYTTKNLKETCYTSPLSECSLGIHWSSTSVHHITNSFNKWWISAHFVLPFTCCRIVFVYLKMTSIHVNSTTKHPADSRKRNTSTVAWFQATDTVWMRFALVWDFTQRLVVSWQQLVVVRFKSSWTFRPSSSGQKFRRNVRNPSPVYRV